jgi:HD-GYP domain-containing protein (c-di-GMP phosphodiesterase class II)
MDQAIASTTPGKAQADRERLIERWAGQRLWALRWVDDELAAAADWLTRPGWTRVLERVRRRLDEGVAESWEVEPGVVGLPLSESGEPAAAVLRITGQTTLEVPEDAVCGAVCDAQQLTAVLRDQWRDADRTGEQSAAIESLSFKLLQAYEETNLLFRLSRSMNLMFEPRELMAMSCAQLGEVLPQAWVAARFADGVGPESLRGLFVTHGALEGDPAELEAQLELELQRDQADDWTRVLHPGRHPIADAVGCEVLLDPIVEEGKLLGFLLCGGKSGEPGTGDEEATSGEMMLLAAAADLLGVFHQNLSRFNEQQQLFFGSLRALSAAIDAKDRYTRGHSERVSWLGEHLARRLGLDRQTVENVRIAGLLHDVGKIGVPEAVLGKDCRLTDREYDLIREHPQIGHDILKGIPQLEPMLPGVLHHHERFDGGGYPHGLAGEDIPLLGRVLGVADMIDAMSSTRTYRVGMARELVLREVAEASGTQLDPSIARLVPSLDLEQYASMLESHRGKIAA